MEEDLEPHFEALVQRMTEEHPSLTLGELRNKRAALKMHMRHWERFFEREHGWRPGPADKREDPDYDQLRRALRRVDAALRLVRGVHDDGAGRKAALRDVALHSKREVAHEQRRRAREAAHQSPPPPQQQQSQQSQQQSQQHHKIEGGRVRVASRYSHGWPSSSSLSSPRREEPGAFGEDEEDDGGDDEQHQEQVEEEEAAGGQNVMAAMGQTRGAQQTRAEPWLAPGAMGAPGEGDDALVRSVTQDVVAGSPPSPAAPEHKQQSAAPLVHDGSAQGEDAAAGCAGQHAGHAAASQGRPRTAPAAVASSAPNIADSQASVSRSSMKLAWSFFLRPMMALVGSTSPPRRISRKSGGGRMAMSI